MMDELMLVTLVLTRVDHMSKQLGEAISRCSSGRGPTAVPGTSQHVLVQLREAISRCSSEASSAGQQAWCLLAHGKQIALWWQSGCGVSAFSVS
jgi:hypothetical protein